MVQKGESQEIGEKGSGTNPERHEVEDERSWTPQKPGKFLKRKLRSLKKGEEEETGVKSTTRLKPLGPLSPGMRMLLQPETEPPWATSLPGLGSSWQSQKKKPGMSCCAKQGSVFLKSLKGA